MFLKAMQDLLGDEVLASEGRLGALDDLYFDGESWQVRYLVVAADAGLEEAPALIAAECVHAVRPRGRILIEPSRMQPPPSASAWGVEAASACLQCSDVCSGRHLMGFRIEAEDGTAGRVADLLVDDEQWSVDYLIVDTAEDGGVRQVLLPPDWVAAIDPVRRTVRVRRTREELRNSPPP